jgi:hypothetical protein
MSDLSDDLRNTVLMLPKLLELQPQNQRLAGLGKGFKIEDLF